MTDTKRLAYSIIQFLHDQLTSGGLSSDAQESLEGTYWKRRKFLFFFLDSGYNVDV